MMEYILPNEAHIYWSLMIVLYPYITGIVAGAFIVSSLYHVFNIKELKPVARFSLVFALAFLFVCTLPLFVHLGHPERALNMILTPSPTSAMAGFGYIYSTYTLLVMIELVFVYRPLIVERSQSATGFIQKIYKFLTFGSTDLSPQALETDQKIIRFLAGIGIPWACLLHGYVGFIFGGVKAVHWWFTPLMPVIFLFSACVSGISGIILGYILIMKYRNQPVDTACLHKLVKFLWGFFIIDLTMEFLDVGTHAYLRVEHWHIVAGLLSGPLFTSFWLLQVGIFSFIPFLLLTWLSLRKAKDSLLISASTLISVMILIQVILMRWNVVVGGQLISKSGRGYAEFHLEWFTKEGIITGLVILLLPGVIMYFLNKLFPFWQKGQEQPARL